MTPEIFTLTTEEGLKIEIDPTKMEEVVFSLLGKKYKILITELTEE